MGVHGRGSGGRRTRVGYVQHVVVGVEDRRDPWRGRTAPGAGAVHVSAPIAVLRSEKWHLLLVIYVVSQV